MKREISGVLSRLVTWLHIVEDMTACPVCTAHKYQQQAMTIQREIAEASYIATRKGRILCYLSLVISWNIWVGVIMVSENCFSKCPHLLALLKGWKQYKGIVCCMVLRLNIFHFMFFILSMSVGSALWSEAVLQLLSHCCAFNINNQCVPTSWPLNSSADIWIDVPLLHTAFIK